MLCVNIRFMRIPISLSEVQGVTQNSFFFKIFKSISQLFNCVINQVVFVICV